MARSTWKPCGKFKTGADIGTSGIAQTAEFSEGLRISAALVAEGGTKRPFKRPPLRERAMETTITLRIPVELKEKLDRISGGKRAEWVRQKIEAERE